MPKVPAALNPLPPPPVDPLAAPALPPSRPMPPPLPTTAPLLVAEADSNPFHMDGSSMEMGGVAPLVRPRRRSSGIGNLVKLALLMAFLLAIVGGIFLTYQKGWLHIDLAQLSPQDTAPATAGQKPHESTLYNYKYQFPTSGWKMDEEAKRDAKALFIMRRQAPETWLALMAQDYKNRTPRDSELVELVVGRLEKYLRSVEYEEKDDSQLGGQRAKHLIFQAVTENGGVVVGEMDLMAYGSIGYGLVAWAPKEKSEESAKDYDDLRKRFALLNTSGPATKRPDPVIFTGTKGGFLLKDADGVWKKNASLENFYKADLALQAPDPSDVEERELAARVLVLVLPKAADLDLADAVARDNFEHLVKQEKPKAKFEVLKSPGKPPSKPPSVGGLPSRVTKFQVKQGDYERFAVLGVLNQPEHIVVIQCDCPFDRREIWERNFEALLASFRLKAKPKN